MAKQTIQLAFIGTGGWARRYHFPTLDALAHKPLTVVAPPFDVDLRLRGVFSLEPDVAARVAGDTGFERVYESLDALIEDPTVDAVAVAVPPEAAHDVVLQVAQKDVPIISEKPPGISTAQAQALAEAVTVPNVVAFNRRFAPLNNRFKQMVSDLDGISYVEGQFFRHNRTEDAFMVGTAIHWINFMEYVIGPIADVTTTGWRNPASNARHRIAQLTFAGGIPGQLQVLPCTGSEVERLIVHTPTRSLYLHGPLSAQAGKIIVHDQGTETVLAPVAAASQPRIVRLGIVGEYVEFLTKACAGLATRSNFRNAVSAMEVAVGLEKAAVSD